MLLATDTLVVDQITNFITTDFAIRDVDGNALGHIRTEGRLAKRMVMGNRDFSVYDGDRLSFTIYDEPNWGRDRFQVFDPEGALRATVVKNITMFKHKLSVSLWEGTELVVRGSWLDYHYEIDGPAGRIANVERSWPGVPEMFLGHDRYVIALAGETKAQVRQAVIGSAIAIDRIRSKSNGNNVQLSF